MTDSEKIRFLVEKVLRLRPVWGTQNDPNHGTEFGFMIDGRFFKTGIRIFKEYEGDDEAAWTAYVKWAMRNQNPMEDCRVFKRCEDALISSDRWQQYFICLVEGLAGWHSGVPDWAKARSLLMLPLDQRVDAMIRTFGGEP